MSIDKLTKSMQQANQVFAQCGITMIEFRDAIKDFDIEEPEPDEEPKFELILLTRKVVV